VTGNLRWGAFLVVLIATWAAASRLGLVDPLLVPPPLAVARTLIAGFRDGSLVIALLSSLGRVCAGFSIGTVLGIGLGALTAKSRWAEDTIGRLILSLQTIPSIAWLPFAMLWFGLNEKAILFVVAIGATLPVAISVESGIRQLPANLSRVARMMGMTQGQMLRWVTIPASVPALAVGMRNAWAFAWRSLLAGELLMATRGLGQVLMLGRELNDMAQVFAVMILIAVLGYVIDQGLFRRLEALVASRWDVAPR
jgi:NitT/TauT family transport system permease protein